MPWQRGGGVRKADICRFLSWWRRENLPLRCSVDALHRSRAGARSAGGGARRVGAGGLLRRRPRPHQRGPPGKAVRARGPAARRRAAHACAEPRAAGALVHRQGTPKQVRRDARGAGHRRHQAGTDCRCWSPTTSRTATARSTRRAARAAGAPTARGSRASRTGSARSRAPRDPRAGRARRAVREGARSGTCASAVDLLARAQTSVCVDAGHSKWQPAGRDGARLAKCTSTRRGFSLNCRTSAAPPRRGYGTALSARPPAPASWSTPSRNGRGPYEDGGLVQPAGRGLGARPTTADGQPAGDAFLWVKVPGESDGPCRHGPPAGAGGRATRSGSRAARAWIHRSSWMTAPRAESGSVGRASMWWVTWFAADRPWANGHGVEAPRESVDPGLPQREPGIGVEHVQALRDRCRAAGGRRRRRARPAEGGR